VSAHAAVMQIGECFVGDGAEAAHVNTVLGTRCGPVGAAWAAALASPRPGHVPFMAVLRPGLAVQPPTLFVNKATTTAPGHEELTWGAAQAGVACGVADALAEGIIDRSHVAELVLIVAVWVSPVAVEAGLVLTNNRAATRGALSAGRSDGPPVDDVLAAAGDPANPFLRPDS
jgi:5,6,7,8-tetrahydromethanopterin hydro-lyase